MMKKIAIEIVADALMDLTILGYFQYGNESFKQTIEELNEKNSI